MSTDELVKAHQEWIDACEKTGNVNSRTYELSRLSTAELTRLSEALAKAEERIAKFNELWEAASDMHAAKIEIDEVKAKLAASEAARERLAEALQPFTRYSLATPYNGVIPAALVRVADVERACAALASAQPAQPGRDAVLEEAAKIADHRASVFRSVSTVACALPLQEECEDIAAAIRKLKSR